MPELVAPVVPDAQKSRAPDLFLEGMRGGLAAMAQFASIRRQAEADVARMALQERMATKEHELTAQRMAQDYELRDRAMTQTEEMLPLQKDAMAAQTQLNTEHAKAFAEGTASAAQIKAEQTKQKMTLLKEVADTAKQFKLDDPSFQTKNPMAFAKNVLEFGRMYHLSPLSEVKQAIKSYQAVADSQKLFIKHGIEEETTDELGAPIKKVKATGNGRQVPAWRIISNINNPETRDQTLRDLEASGYIELAQGFQEFSDNGKKVKVPNKTTQLRQPVRGMLTESLKLDSSAEPPNGVASATPSQLGEKPMPDYGPDDKPKYPIGTRGRRGGKWFVLTGDGWKPE